MAGSYRCPQKTLRRGLNVHLLKGKVFVRSSNKRAEQVEVYLTFMSKGNPFHSFMIRHVLASPEAR